MKKLKYLLLIIMVTFFTSAPLVKAEVPSGEIYSEFATNRTVLLTLFTSTSDVNLFAYTPRLNEFLNGSLSLVRYEDNSNDTYSNWAIRIYQSSRSAGNYTMNWVTEWIDSTTAQEFCSASSKPIPKGGETNSTVCNVVGNTAYLSINYKLNTADTGTAYVDFELTANGISINWFLRLATAVYYPQIVESSYVDTETLTQQQQTIINQNQQQITQNNTIINQQQQINDKLNEVLEQDKVCNYIDYTNVIQESKLLDVNGIISSDQGNYGITDYINIQKSEISVVSVVTGNAPSLCFYNVNKNLISCIKNNTLTVNQKLSIPDNATYVRFTISKLNNAPTFKICKSGNQALNDNLNNLNQNITSEKLPDLDGLNNSAGWLPAGAVDSILNLPLSLFNSLTTVLSATCQPVNLTFPFINYNYQLPCVDDIYAKIGHLNSLLNTIGFIVSALILYKYFLSLYTWVDDTLTFRENHHHDWGGV